MSSQDDTDVTLKSEKTTFQAKRESLHLHQDGEHAEGGHGGTEMGWLVSYADMMTLLFGLFVILFSLKHSAGANVDDVMREVSKKYFTNQDGQEKQPTGPSSVTPESQDSSVSSSSESTEAKESAEVSENQDLKQKIEELKAEVESLQQEKTEAVTQVKNIQRKVAAEAPPSGDSKNDIKTLQSNVEEMKEQNAQLQSEIEQKNKDFDQLKSESEKLQKNAQRYMMVLLTWETEKQDLDLQVITPSHKQFNFKKRKIAGEPGSFELDSRYGPGIEMWKAENFGPGTYSAKVSLYNQNGNKSPAQVNLSVLTNRGSYRSPAFSVDEKNTEKEIEFSVTPEGEVSWQP
jgi:flagellar motor protein MotB